MDIIGEPDSPDHTVNVVLVCQGVTETFEHEHPRTFPDHEAIGVRVEWRWLAAN